MEPDLKVALDEIRSQMATKADVEDLRGGIGQLDGRLDAVETGVEGLRGEVGNLDVRLGAVETSVEGVRSEMGNLAGRTAGVEAGMEGLRREIGNLDRRIANVETSLGARIDAQGRELRQALADIQERIDKGFAARKQDEDLALREIRAVKRRVTSLERRVKLLETKQP